MSEKVTPEMVEELKTFTEHKDSLLYKRERAAFRALLSEWEELKRENDLREKLAKVAQENCTLEDELRVAHAAMLEVKRKEDAAKGLLARALEYVWLRMDESQDAPWALRKVCAALSAAKGK